MTELMQELEVALDAWKAVSPAVGQLRGAKDFGTRNGRTDMAAEWLLTWLLTWLLWRLLQATRCSTRSAATPLKAQQWLLAARPCSKTSWPATPIAQ
jgi:hypothetical protein